MDKSPHGGIVLDKHAEDFLIINVNEIVDGHRNGYTTLVFEGNLSTAAKIRDIDLMIEGVWGHHATFGTRFDVHAWRPVDRPVIEQPALKKKTRRLSAVPDKLKKPRPRRLSAVPSSPAPSKADIKSTNDWYAQSEKLGRHIALKHVLSLDFLATSADIMSMKLRSINIETQQLAVQLLVFVVVVVAAFYLGAAIL